MENKKLKIAYNVVERNGRSFWQRIGVGFVNADNSVNVKLECLPVNGELQLRDYVPREAGAPNTDDAAANPRRATAANRSLTEAA